MENTIHEIAIIQREKTLIRTKESVKALWDEYRVAAQYAKEWARVEEILAMNCLKLGKPVPVEAEATLEAGIGHAVPSWMEAIEPPQWFEDLELGRNERDPVWMTNRELAAMNRSNLEKLTKREVELKRSASTRRVLRRVVTG